MHIVVDALLIGIALWSIWITVPSIIAKLRRPHYAIAVLILLPCLAHAQTATDTATGWLPYLVILGPLLGAIMLPLVAWGLARVTGLEAKLHDWLVAHKQSKAADLVDSAWGIIDRWVETSAGVLAGQMTNGDLSWTERAAWQVKAQAEITTLEQRAPGVIAQAATKVPDVLAQLMASVDAKMVAAPVGLSAATPIPGAQLMLGSTVTAADTIADAVAQITGARTALAALETPATANDAFRASIPTLALQALQAAAKGRGDPPAETADALVPDPLPPAPPAVAAAPAAPADLSLSPGGIILPTGAPMQTGAA